MAKSKLSRLFVSLLVAVVAFASVAWFAAAGISPSCAFAGGLAFAADEYGGTNATGLWYYKNSALDVYGAKEITDGYKAALKGTDPIVIAVVDTGMTISHEIFDGVLLKNDRGEVMGANSTVPDNGGAVDISDVSANRHGNRVAGIIAMLIHEMELEDFIKIYPVKASVINSKQQDAFSIANVTEAINRAVDKAHADVINFSFGIQYSEQTKEWDTNRQLAYAINRAAEDGALIVAAAGNNGKKANVQQVEEAFYPAALDGVFSVMGYGEDGELYQSSNYGLLYDIAAPAQNIYSSTDDYGNGGAYGYDNGTSMATPIVSFAAALLKLRYRAEGLEEPDTQTLAIMLKSFDFESIDHDGVDIHKIDFGTLLSQPIDEVELNYVRPTAIRISHDAAVGTGDNADSIFYADPREVPEINFVATLSPYGMTDPVRNGFIEWILRDSNGVETSLGRGRTLKYKPTVYGKTELIARLALSSTETIQYVQKLNINYLKFVAGDARVTYEKCADLAAREAPTSGVLYTGATTVFSFTGADYVDPNVEIKWYVDRVYVASGKTFAYKPKTAGEHLISIQYGDEPPTHTPGIAFVATVKPFILRPLDLSMLILGIVIALTGGVTLAVMYAKRKRELDPRPPKEESEKKPKKQKRDKNVKIAKR